MLRGYAFYLFLSVLPIPLIFFYPLIITVYLFVIVAVCFVFFRPILKPMLFLFLFVLFSSFVRYETLKKLDKNRNTVVEFKGIVLKQKNTRFNTEFRVFVPLMKTRKGELLSLCKVYTVKTPLFFNDLTGSILEITGILLKEKIYNNPFSSNYYYLLSNNRVFWVKVKDKRFIDNLKEVKLLRFRQFLTKDFSDYKVKQFLNAIVFGQKESLDFRFKERVKKLGIYHIFVLSGFHFGIFSFIIWIFLFFVPLRNRYKKLIVLLVLTVFLFLTAFSPPSLRVYLMILVYLVFGFDGIDLEPIDAIGIAGIIMLAFNPFNSLNPGFLMSFFASAGIVIAVRNKSAIYSFFIIPFAAFFVMMPFYLYLFNYIPFLAPLNNLIIIPFVVLLFWLLIFNLLTLGSLSWFLEWYVLKLISLLNCLPSLSLEVFPYLFIVLMSLFAVCYFFFKRNIKTFSILSLLILFFALLMPMRLNRDLICFFDSRLPQSVFINAGGENILINTGDSYFVSMCLKKELRFRGVEKIDILILESLNTRNIDRLENLCERFKVQAIVFRKDDLTVPYRYRLKWISRFFAVKKMIGVENGKKLKLNNDCGVEFLENGLRVAAKDKTICFCGKSIFSEDCDFIVLKRLKGNLTESKYKKILISGYCDFNKKNVYSIEKNGGFCIKLK